MLRILSSYNTAALPLVSTTIVKVKCVESKLGYSWPQKVRSYYQ